MELPAVRWRDWQRPRNDRNPAFPLSDSSDWLADMSRRVVITGIGCITPIGTTVEGLWAGLRCQRSAVTEVSRFDPSLFRSHLAAEVRDFMPEDFLERKRARRLDR